MARTTRRTIVKGGLLGAAALVTSPLVPAAGRAPSIRRGPIRDVIRMGVIGVRGRGRGHVGAFKGSNDSEVVAIADPDEGVIGATLSSVPDAVWHRDLRALLDDDTIDAVSIATPNHWHSLAAVWAMDAGKHVYVEKPVSHNVYEGRQVVNAARRYGRICQHGTQSRSSQATRDAMAWLHGGGLGEVKIAHGLCFKPRGSIGKVDGPQDPPETCDYDLWTGPAAKTPLMRKNLHYDWHWDFETGNGDIGNQGVHQMDIARWGLGVEGLPKRARSVGCRLGYVDDANTPNTQVALLDYGDKRVIFEVRGLRTDAFHGAKIGVVFFGEKGTLVSASYEKLHAYDHDGEVIETFQGGGNHFQNFLDAVKADDDGVLNAQIREGHPSAALGHLANVSYQLGEERTLADVSEPFGEGDAANGVFESFRAHLESNGIDAKEGRVLQGPQLAFDARAERFVGEGAERANGLLTREYRAPFIVPELA